MDSATAAKSNPNRGSEQPAHFPPPVPEPRPRAAHCLGKAANRRPLASASRRRTRGSIRAPCCATEEVEQPRAESLPLPEAAHRIPKRDAFRDAQIAHAPFRERLLRQAAHFQPPILLAPGCIRLVHHLDLPCDAGVDRRAPSISHADDCPTRPPRRGSLPNGRSGSGHAKSGSLDRLAPPVPRRARQWAHSLPCLHRHERRRSGAATSPSGGGASPSPIMAVALLAGFVSDILQRLPPCRGAGPSRRSAYDITSRNLRDDQDRCKVRFARTRGHGRAPRRPPGVSASTSARPDTKIGSR